MKHLILIVAILALAAMACGTATAVAPVAPATYPPQPTYTPYPTQIPPTSIPVRADCSRVEFLAWTALVTPILNSVVDDMNTVVAYANNEDLVGIMSFAAEAGPRVRDQARQVQDSNPPPCAEKANGLTVQALDEYAASYGYMVKGDISSATTWLTKATDLINQAKAALPSASDMSN